MNTYNPKDIERKWQEIWDKERVFEFSEKPKRPKLYILDMYPYPSSDGLHVGHPEGYTATDIIARYQKMRGFNVLRPMGWDAFGLPAENFAVKSGVHPLKTTQKSIDRFREQIKSIGLGYDWSREISTADPRYYKWTQWLFLYLYKKGLAYRKEAPVNWCPSCQTVLANEQVKAGECERCGSQVVQKNLAQWFFKTTEYADRLLSGLEDVDWPENIKEMQRNWIGRSEGALIKFPISNSQFSIEIFTTRPDTLFGATYMVLAPEHPLVNQLIGESVNRGEIEKYIKEAKAKTELERISEDGKEKTGVEIKGVKAINPANEEEIPIWIADYVLGSYGTGAIMAVPAHDTRDWEFAKKYDLPIKEVIESPEGWPKDIIYTGLGIIKNSIAWMDGLLSEDAAQEIVGELEYKGAGREHVNYKLRDWLISRQRYWGAPIPIIYCDKCALQDPSGQGIVPVPEKDLPVELPMDVDFKPTGISPLAENEEFLNVKCPDCGQKARREVDTMDTFVDSSWYYLRYIDPENKKEIFDKKKVKATMPVDLYVGGAEHAVLHLLYARFITKALADGDFLSYQEPFLKLRNQGLILGEGGEKMSKSKGNVVNPDDVIEDYGADTFRMYEMFMGPFEDAKPWDTKGIIGIFRFLTRVWKFGQEIGNVSAGEELDDTKELRQLTHKTIKKVESDIASFSFNTAISALMILLTKIEEEKSVTSFKTFLLLLYPFAPHLSCEIWESCGFNNRVYEQEWPKVIDKYLKEEETRIVVQVDGRVRDTLVLPVGLTEKDLVSAAKKSKNVKKHLEDKKIVKEIVVLGKLVNFVTK